MRWPPHAALWELQRAHAHGQRHVLPGRATRVKGGQHALPGCDTRGEGSRRRGQHRRRRRLTVGAGGSRLALGGVGVGSARPQVGPVGNQGHAARDDELGGDEAVDEHAQHEHEPDLVKRGRVPDEQRAEGQRHDDSRGADDAARVLQRVDDGLLGAGAAVVLLDDTLHEEDVVVEAQADHDGEGDARAHPEEVAARRLQRRPAEALQQAELVDGDGGAEDEAEHPHEADHRAQRHEGGAEGGSQHEADDAQRDADHPRQRGEGVGRAVHLLGGHPGQVEAAQLHGGGPVAARPLAARIRRLRLEARRRGARHRTAHRAHPRLPLGGEGVDVDGHTHLGRAKRRVAVLLDDAVLRLGYVPVERRQQRGIDLGDLLPELVELAQQPAGALAADRHHEAREGGGRHRVVPAVGGEVGRHVGGHALQRVAHGVEPRRLGGVGAGGGADEQRRGEDAAHSELLLQRDERGGRGVAHRHHGQQALDVIDAHHRHGARRRRAHGEQKDGHRPP